MKKILVLLFIWLVINPLFAQQHGNIENFLNDFIESIPTNLGNHYQVPSESELDTWRQILSEFYAGQYYDASNKAATLNYELIQFTDDALPGHNQFYIFQEKYPRTHYWGIYVFSADPVYSDLVLQAPHPSYDTNTGLQSIFCFRRLIPRALFISGAHRCDNNALSQCSGTTTACGSSSAYRVSDNAHNTNSVFQVMTEALFDHTEQTHFVQLHGFAKLSSDPYLIMSNGTHEVPDVDYITQLQIELQKVDPVLTFKIAHVHTDWNRLIATTNTQGRYINSSADPCHQNASSTNGRFIHIEQEKSRLRSDSTGWYKMYQALKNAFIPDSVNNTSYTSNPFKFDYYPNPSQGTFWIHIDQDTEASLWILDLTGQARFTKPVAGHEQIDVSFLRPGSYLLQLRTQTQWLTEKLVLVQ